MKKLLIIGMALANLACFAETYALKSDTSVWLLDDNGKKVKSVRLKSGTKLQTVETGDDVSGDAGAKSAKVIPVGTVKTLAPKMFKATLPKMQAVKFTNCECEIDDYYNYSFENCQKTHWSVAFTVRDAEGDSLGSFHGYVAKNSPAGKKIVKVLSDGKEHKLNLVVRYTKEATHDTSELVEIVGCED